MTKENYFRNLYDETREAVQIIPNFPVRTVIGYHFHQWETQEVLFCLPTYLAFYVHVHVGD